MTLPKEVAQGSMHLGICCLYVLQETYSESEISAAPTTIYGSPFDTPRHPSFVDMTMTSKVSRYDLREQIQRAFNGKSVQCVLLNGCYQIWHNSFFYIFLCTQCSICHIGENFLLEVDQQESLERLWDLEMPVFGVSPGPTPSPSPPSTPATPTSIGVSEVTFIFVWDDETYCIVWAFHGYL